MLRWIRRNYYYGTLQTTVGLIHVVTDSNYEHTPPERRPSPPICHHQTDELVPISKLSQTGIQPRKEIPENSDVLKLS